MKTKIIADVSSNHMGNMAVAEAMIETAAQVGVDMVKFQSWQAEKLRHDFPDYEGTFKRHRKAELSDEDHEFLMEACRNRGVEFLTTCFDVDRVDFLADIGLRTIKVASPDCTSFRLLDLLMDRFEHLIISTGMTSNDDVEKMIKHVKGHKVTVLHCVSLYPTTLDRVNLARMEWIRTLGVSAGFSDHTRGVEAGTLAIAMGAEILEKHFTLSTSLPGKDQAMSSTPDVFARLSDWANLVVRMKGVQNPALSNEELKLRDIYVGKWGNNK